MIDDPELRPRQKRLGETMATEREVIWADRGCWPNWWVGSAPQPYRPLGGGRAGQPKGQRAEGRTAESEAELVKLRSRIERLVEGLPQANRGRVER